ncbi:MAG: DmsE family decaheme c-type cytochrome, partial [Sulfuritalea sp.]|nr:DmsE family decaheme c-type cytochrome [Sulfuritalea sp.]
MKQWQRILAVCAATAGLGFLVAATPALAAEPAKAALTGDAVCTRCHDEGDGNVLKLYQTKHGVRGDARTPGCQSCHGTSDGHLKAKKTLPDVVFGKNKSEARAQDTACLTCHKSDKRTHWDGGQHQINDVSCSNCHSVHASTDKVRSKKTQAEVCFACHKDQRNDSRKISHHPIGEGKVVCSSCHNPHGSAGPKQLAKNTVNETCFTCHAEKRGPFLWEHQPATENCA